ncbi:ATP-binding cassette domain-containing protein [Litorilinea aerophila]|uniref:ATP-binding cassette domain-containing protein n=1 Tax=Litorilinea aerophila TaxID=1204385 RepID=A0A540VK03_9CHLR|nr:ATP-binding cassette domain-containing protein [Litorilinea aerophila]MCC9075188.1 ATP-binding cassette domain-containing protein [Litorilinea aerophila]GIV78321.1 MAG: cobalt ABC transporter ATP-binding protein [Litorilinea sp.]
MHHTIEVEDLYFTYPDGREALRGVNLTVPPGVKMTLVGPNGAGKSTLMLHLNGILRGEGRVRVAGMEMNEENLPRIRAAVGMVFQNPDDQLFSLTVFDDVAFGPLHMGLPEADVLLRVETALRAVGMSEYRNRVSHHLSMGEKKRIAIATVLSMHPEILVLDEPSAGLDPRARRMLINLLKGLDMTMLISSHDMPLVAELAEQTAIMDNGQVVACGPTAQLLADHALLERHGLAP